MPRSLFSSFLGKPPAGSTAGAACYRANLSRKCSARAPSAAAWRNRGFEFRTCCLQLFESTITLPGQRSNGALERPPARANARCSIALRLLPVCDRRRFQFGEVLGFHHVASLHLALHFGSKVPKVVRPGGGSHGRSIAIATLEYEADGSIRQVSLAKPWSQREPGCARRVRTRGTSARTARAAA
jgi:hypothetical protein